MRLAVTAAAVVITAATAHAQEGLFQRDHGAIAAPVVAAAIGAPPPEGAGPGGLDFGAWRSAGDGYGAAFETRVRAHLAGKDARAALSTDGFSCLTPAERNGAGPALECRRTAVVDGCEHEWWAVQEQPGAAALAGRDVYCARR